MTVNDDYVQQHSVLLAGATGMLGGRIAHHLLRQPGVTVRLLFREGVSADPAKAEALRALQSQRATLVSGDVIVEGQVALARAARGQGAWRIVPSDFALNLFAATPGEHPSFDQRREADQASPNWSAGPFRSSVTGSAPAA